MIDHDKVRAALEKMAAAENSHVPLATWKDACISASDLLGRTFAALEQAENEIERVRTLAERILGYTEHASVCGYLWRTREQIETNTRSACTCGLSEIEQSITTSPREQGSSRATK